MDHARELARRRQFADRSVPLPGNGWATAGSPFLRYEARKGFYFQAGPSGRPRITSVRSSRSGPAAVLQGPIPALVFWQLLAVGTEPGVGRAGYLLPCVTRVSSAMCSLGFPQLDRLNPFRQFRCWPRFGSSADGSHDVSHFVLTHTAVAGGSSRCRSQLAAVRVYLPPPVGYGETVEERIEPCSFCVIG